MRSTLCGGLSDGTALSSCRVSGGRASCLGLSPMKELFVFLFLISVFAVGQARAEDTYPYGVYWHNNLTNGATKSTLVGTFTNSCGSGTASCSIEQAMLYKVINLIGYSYLSHTIDCSLGTGSCSYTAQRGAPYNSPNSGSVYGYSTGVAYVPPETVCDNTAGNVSSSGYYDLGTDENVNPPTSTCDGECILSYNGSGVVARQMVGGVYHYFSLGSYSRTSSTCSAASDLASTASPPSVSCNASTQDTGIVNGVTVCLEKQNVTNEESTTISETVDDVTTETTTTTKTNPDGSTSTTTTTNTTNNVTGAKTSDTTTMEEPVNPSSFCTANPNDPSCKPTDDICAERPETLGCSELGNVGDVSLGSEERGISAIVPVTVGGGSASCPDPLTASFMGQGVSFSWQPACDAATWLRPLVLSFAWLAAGIIFIGGVRQ